MFSTKALSSWDEELTLQSEGQDNWEAVSNLSVASSSSVCATPSIKSRKFLVHNDKHGVQSDLRTFGKLKWTFKTKATIWFVVVTVMVVSTVSVRTDSRITQASTSSLYREKVLSLDRRSKSYHQISRNSSRTQSSPEQWKTDNLQYFANVSRIPVKSTDVPFFFHIPRSAGGTVKDILSLCFGFTLATDLRGSTHGTYRPNSLEILRSDDGALFVNVDTSTQEGINTAKSIGLLESGVVKAVTSQHLHAAADLFDGGHMGRCFTMIRHPIERAVSMFHYLAVANWEPSYDPSLAYISIEMYARSRRAENNWMVRFLSNEFVDDLSDQHVEIAKQVLREKCLIGLLDQKEDSLQRFEQYFGWNATTSSQEDCRDRKLLWERSGKQSHPRVEVGSIAWDLLYKENSFDMLLYEFALTLFEEQGKLFENNFFR